MYSELTKMCPELETLNLCDNQLSYPAEMNHLVGLKNLTTLSLMGNPLAERSDRDVISYSSSFRKLFPALKQLVSRLCTVSKILGFECVPAYTVHVFQCNV